MTAWRVSFFDEWEAHKADIEYCHDWDIGYLCLGAWLNAQQNFDIVFSSARMSR